MNRVFALITAAGLAAPLLSQVAPASKEECLHVRTSFSFVVNASLAVTAPLFGPEGERAWVGKHWDPVFIHPQPARDVEGMVFTLRRDPFNEVWVNTLFDMEGRHFQYVYMLQDLAVTVIDVRFKLLGADSTEVDVVFTRTAITPQGNEQVTAMSETDKSAPQVWKKKIDECLARNKAGI